jgi:hypothetical protein
VSRLHTSFVLGYHGCEEHTGRRAVAGDIPLLQSTRPFDWIGRGAYFWEGDPQRAYEWALQKKERGDYQHPFVIGAVVDLGNCLDLMVREHNDAVRSAYRALRDIKKKSGRLMPKNIAAPKDKSRDLVMRYLDCEVLNHLHTVTKEKYLPPFDTVRALLPEGRRLYPGSGLRAKTHVQIAVVNLDCIKGVFHVKGPWSPGDDASNP